MIGSHVAISAKGWRTKSNNKGISAAFAAVLPLFSCRMFHALFCSALDEKATPCGRTSSIRLSS